MTTEQEPVQAPPSHQTPYQAALQRIIDTGNRGIKAGPERVQALLEALGHPERGLRGVLVAGTNGKGSVCALVDSVLRTAGVHSVLLTKPHLRSYRERFRVDGAEVAPDRFAALVHRVLDAAGEVEHRAGAPTQFEVLTAMGIVLAAEERGAECVCEVGLGGRMDATNVLDLGVAAITGVALDHTDLLGDTVEEIAAEKAGIIKPGDVVVTGAQGAALDIIERRAAEVGARSVVRAPLLDTRSEGGDGITVTAPGLTGAPLTLRVALPGVFQAANAAVALEIVRALAARGVGIDDEAIRRGFESVRWPGRVQWIPGDPPLILDSAHNPAAVAALVPAVRELCGERPCVLLFGAMQDKDAAGMLDELHSVCELAVMTQAGTPRARSAVDLARGWGLGARAVGSLPDALTAARMLAGDDGVVLVTGSLYLVGDVMGLLEYEAPAG